MQFWMNGCMLIDWSNYFIYDPTIPNGIRWKVDRKSGKNFNQNHIQAGDPAGNLVISKEGLPPYVDVRLHRK